MFVTTYRILSAVQYMTLLQKSFFHDEVVGSMRALWRRAKPPGGLITQITYRIGVNRIDNRSISMRVLRACIRASAPKTRIVAYRIGLARCDMDLRLP